jgi:hypothetical protein
MTEPTGAQIEEEFGVKIVGPGQIGVPGWWYAKIPGTRVWVDGYGLSGLRDELIRHKWIADAATARAELEASESH